MIVARKSYLWRTGAISIIQKTPELSLVADIDNIKPIAQVYRDKQPDVILLEPCLVYQTDFGIVKSFYEDTIHPCILLTGNPSDEDNITTAFEYGIKGYILTTCTEEQFIDAIQTVKHNNEWYSPELTPKLFQMTNLNRIMESSKPRFRYITQRELEILNLMVKGYNNSEMSEIMHLSVHTVQNHICNIYSKLGIRERLKVVHYAIQNGMVEV